MLLGGLMEVWGGPFRDSLGSMDSGPVGTIGAQGGRR